MSKKFKEFMKNVSDHGDAWIAMHATRVGESGDLKGKAATEKFRKTLLAAGYERELYSEDEDGHTYHYSKMGHHTIELAVDTFESPHTGIWMIIND